ncbi:MAG: HAD family hydrolase [Ilumatobacteraceae bacterium]
MHDPDPLNDTAGRSVPKTRDGSDVHAVLFDFGNTLFAHASVDQTVQRVAIELGSDIGAAEAARIAARIHALAEAPTERHHQRDLHSDVWAARWTAFYSIADGQHPGLGELLYAAMHDPFTWLPYAAVPTMLRNLRDAGIKIAVVSNTGWDVRAAFRAHGLFDLVDEFVLSCEVGVAKPSPAIFLHAAAAVGEPPSALVMVGDDPVADAGAVSAGIRTLLLPACPAGHDNGVGVVVAMTTNVLPDGTSARLGAITR